MALQLSALAAGATAKTSAKEQHYLASAECLPLRLPPPYPAWLMQAGANLKVLLAAKALEAFVLDIDAIPHSPAQPIAPTLSSEAGSPTSTYVLQRGASATTASPTKSAASTSSSVSQGAGRQNPATLLLASFVARLYTTHGA